MARFRGRDDTTMTSRSSETAACFVWRSRVLNGNRHSKGCDVPTQDPGQSYIIDVEDLASDGAYGVPPRCR